VFRAAYNSSSGALTVFAASGLHMHVVTGRSQVKSVKSDLTTAGIRLHTHVVTGRSQVKSDLTTAGHHMRM
jgi:hypothetical protein